MKVKDIMTDNIRAVLPQTSVAEVAKIMKEENTGFVPVTAEGYLSGVITDRDIALRCVAEGIEPDSLVAKDIMSRRLIYISPDHSVTEAARLMAHEQIRRLPVCDDRRLVGVISLGDISRCKSFFSETASAFCDISKKD